MIIIFPDNATRPRKAVYLCDDSSCESELLDMECPCDSCLESARAERGVTK